MIWLTYTGWTLASGTFLLLGVYLMQNNDVTNVYVTSPLQSSNLLDIDQVADEYLITPVSMVTTTRTNINSCGVAIITTRLHHNKTRKVLGKLLTHLHRSHMITICNSVICLLYNHKNR